MKNSKHRISFIQKSRYFLKNFIKITGKKICYVMKLLLFYLFKLTKKIIPPRIKIIIKVKFLSYPILYNFLKYIFSWVNEIEYSKKPFNLEYFLILLIRKNILPLLKSMVNETAWESIVLEQLKKNPHLLIHIKKSFIKEVNSSAPSYIPTSPLLTADATELSPDADEVYRKLKTMIACYQNHYLPL